MAAAGRRLRRCAAAAPELAVGSAVLLVRAVAPLAVSLVVLLLLGASGGAEWLSPLWLGPAARAAQAVPAALRCWAVLEVGCTCWFVVRLAQLQARTTPTPFDTAGRRAAVERTLAATPDPVRFVSGWFKFAPFSAIRWGNAVEWVALAVG